MYKQASNTHKGQSSNQIQPGLSGPPPPLPLKMNTRQENISAQYCPVYIRDSRGLYSHTEFGLPYSRSTSILHNFSTVLALLRDSLHVFGLLRLSRLTPRPLSLSSFRHGQCSQPRAAAGSSFRAHEAAHGRLLRVSYSDLAQQPSRDGAVAESSHFPGSFDCFASAFHFHVFTSSDCC